MQDPSTRPASGRGRARARLASVGLALFTSAALFGAAEAWLRAKEGRSDDTPLHAGGEPPYVPRLLPNVVAWRNGVEVRTNALGLRGPEIGEGKPTGCLRIVSVGDSYTFGTGVREEATVPAALGRALAASLSGRCVESLNLGIDGANAYDNTARLVHIGLPLDPDLAIYFFLFNDVWQMERGEAALAARIRKPEEGRLARDAARRQSYVVRYLAPRAANLVRAITGRKTGKLATWDAQFQPRVPAWENTKGMILEARDACAENHVRMVVALLPAFALFRDGAYPLDGYRKEVSSFCHGAGIELVDLHEPFWGRSGRRYWINPLDPHPNAEACAIMARCLATEITMRNLLGPADSLGAARAAPAAAGPVGVGS